MKGLMKAMLLAAFVAVWSVTGSAAETAPVSAEQKMAAETVTLVNEERAKAGLPVLAEEAELTAIALVRAGEQASLFSHTRPDGTDWFTAFDAVDYSRFASVEIGENLAKGCNTASEAVAAWMASPAHKANILGANYKSVGITVVNNNGTYYWAEEFAG